LKRIYLNTVSLLVFLCVLGLCRCSSTQSGIDRSPQEIDDFIKAYPECTEIDKACLESGEVKMSVSIDVVHFLLGKPTKIEIDNQPWGEQKRLHYKGRADFKVLIFQDKRVVGIE
jgi:hypothetical protein